MELHDVEQDFSGNYDFSEYFILLNFINSFDKYLFFLSPHILNTFKF